MLEQLYQDFTNKVLPKVAEGFAITKDYFFDLFGRYVKYLIVTDLITIVAILIGLAISVRVAFVCKKKYVEMRDANVGKHWEDRKDPDGWVFFMAGMIFASVILGVFLVSKTMDLTKAIYVPEIRIYQELQPLMAK